MDPYKVLGVSRDADEETIKKAYRELVKKYHPDKYVNTPMAEVANEKMKEINEAYDMITKGTANQHGSYGGGYNPFGGNPFGGFGGYGGYGGGTGSYGGSGGDYSQVSYQSVRVLLNIGRIADAERMLNQLPKNAEWHFLYGMVCMRRGWYDRAVENIQMAVNMEPNNIEYRSVLENIQNRNRTYTSSPYNTSTIRCGACPSSLCALCLCWNCCHCC